jgi:hypothetical protein
VIDFAALGIVINPHGPDEQRAACPRCDMKRHDETVGVNIRTGAFQCFRCKWKGRAGRESNALPPPIRILDPAHAERKRERLRCVWSETFPLAHPKAHATRRYLIARGLAEILAKPPEVLRAHPSLAYHEAGAVDRLPAMIGLFTGPSGDSVTLHATYLSPDGTTKASVRAPKKLLQVPTRGSTKGGAIRLYRAEHGVMGIAEGIETALSLMLLQRVPVWAAGSADALERVQLPRGLSRLYVAADIDASGKGEQAARTLAVRVRAWKPSAEVFIVTPDGEGTRDLNDELRRRLPG